MSDSAHVDQPAYAGGVLAVVAAVSATGTLAPALLHVSIAGVEGVGALLLLGSGLFRRRGHPVVGGGLVVTGCALVCLSLALGAFATGGSLARIPFLGGLLATVFVTLGVVPLRRSWARGCNRLAAVLFSCCVVFSAWAADPTDFQVVAGSALLLVAWDAAEHSITLGEDVGRSAQTRQVAVVHAAGSLVVGLAAGIVVFVARWLELPAVPDAAFALLLSAILMSLLVLFLGDSDNASSP